MNMMPQPQMGMGGAMMPQITPEMIEEAENIVRAPSWEEVSEILHSDLRRAYQVDIETDSTVFEDAEAEKMARVEYLTAMQQLFTNMMPLMERHPKLAPVVKEVTMFANGGFKIGRHLEESIEDAFDALQNIEPQPDPEQMKIQAQQQMEQERLKADLQKQQAEAQIRAQENEQQLAFREKEHQIKLAEQQATLQFKQTELAFKERELQMKQAAETFRMELDSQNAQFEQGLRREEQQAKREDMQFNRQAQQEDRRFKMAEAGQRFNMDREKASFEREQTGFGDGAEPIKQQIAGIAEIIQQSIEQQAQIAQSLEAVSQQAVETSEALRAVIGYMRAPKTVKRDASGRAMGITVGDAPEGDLSELMAGLKAGLP